MSENSTFSVPGGGDPIERPRWLASLHEQQQAATPFFGVGCGVAEVRRGSLEKAMARVAASADLFLPAPSSEEIRSVAPSVLPSVVLKSADGLEELRGELQEIAEAWAGLALEPSGGPEVRAFQQGSYVLDHVRLAPRGVFRCVLCLESRLEAPWPFRVQEIDGNWHQVELKPGQLLLVEGSRLLHGRPWPLRGAYELALSAHFGPVGLGGFGPARSPLRLLS